MPNMVRRIAVVAVSAVCLWSVTTAGQRGQAPQQPTFRSGILLVPVDVRVLDRRGQPVNDLRKEDFAIVEDGVPQQISFLERQTLVAGQPDPDAPLALPKTRPRDLRLQNRRVFFVVFGRHWLPRAKFGVVEAVTQFLRERLLPQDYAAVSAFGRATDITTDHEAVARVVERLLAYLKAIEELGGVKRVVKTRALYTGAPEVQQELDAVFEVGSVAGRSLPPRADVPEMRRLLRQIEQNAEGVGRDSPPFAGHRPDGRQSAESQPTGCRTSQRKPRAQHLRRHPVPT